LNERLLRDLQNAPRSQVKTALHALIPARLLSIVLRQAGIPETLPVGELTKAMRMCLIDTLKGLELCVKGARGSEEAVVTRGGVRVREINASTMESRRIKGLFFAGEVLDVDATTGGYNLQIAWSTGALAGDSIE
jgi:predicted Rossmann fold flavoprotein